jgi:hypothetical protein
MGRAETFFRFNLFCERLKATVARRWAWVPLGPSDSGRCANGICRRLEHAAAADTCRGGSAIADPATVQVPGTYVGDVVYLLRLVIWAGIVSDLLGRALPGTVEEP